MKLLDLLGITSSKGVFRMISIVLSGLSMIPALAPYAELLRQIALILGGAGVVKAEVIERIAPKALVPKGPGSVVTFERP